MTHSPVLSRAGERLAASGSSSSGIRPRGIFAPQLHTSPSPDSTNNRRHLHHYVSVTHQKRSRSVRTEQEATLTTSSVSSTPTLHPRHSSTPPIIDPATGPKQTDPIYHPTQPPATLPVHFHRYTLTTGLSQIQNGRTQLTCVTRQNPNARSHLASHRPGLATQHQLTH